MVIAYTTDTAALVVLTSVSDGLPAWALVTAALLIPATASRVQLKVAPAVAEVAVYAKVEPLQTAAGVRLLLRLGVGLTTTETDCWLRTLVVGLVVVTRYVTVIGLVVVFVRVSLMLVDTTVSVVTAALLMPATAARVQV